MQTHTSSQTAQNERVGSCDALDVPTISFHEAARPSPGVNEKDRPGTGGIPLGDHAEFDPREFVVESVLRAFVMDSRPRTKRAAAAVMLRFAKRNGLRIYRIGRTRLYRSSDFFHALSRESQARLARP
jgi:hypothetical protein